MVSETLLNSDRFAQVPRTVNSTLADSKLVLPAILICAFAGRVAVRLHYGEVDFWRNSYSLFYQTAESLVAGNGFCYQWAGLKCAHRPPVYPLFLIPSVWAGKSFVLIVILQSLVGAATALCAYFLARELFNKTTGLVAAAGVAIYPYFVMHDTALQETGLFTFLTALAMLLLLKVRNSPKKLLWAASGIALGLAVLTRATLIVFVPFAFFWVLFVTGRTRRESILKAGVVVLGFLLVVSPWLMRNYKLFGSPLLTTMAGSQLWIGNNAQTFTHYPTKSIDRSTQVAWQSLSSEELDSLRSLYNHELAQNSWFLQRAWVYIKAHPGQTLARAFLKVGAAFSWRQSPGREPFVQAVYFISYVPVLILALVGGWTSRKSLKTLSLIYGLFLSFILVTAVFFGHTSHRVYLDVYLLVLGASAAVRILDLMINRQQSSVGLQG